MNRLEQRYRWLLSWYPPEYRLAYEEEMIGVLMAGARSRISDDRLGVSRRIWRGMLPWQGWAAVAALSTMDDGTPRVLSLAC